MSTPEKIAAERWLKEHDYDNPLVACWTGSAFNPHVSDLLTAYAQGPRADAGVLEAVNDMLKTVAANKHIESSRLALIERLEVGLKQIQRTLAESALSRPQSAEPQCNHKTESEAEQCREKHILEAMDEPISARQLCAECKKPIALRHVMEGDGTHKAQPTAEGPKCSEGFADCSRRDPHVHFDAPTPAPAPEGPERTKLDERATGPYFNPAPPTEPTPAAAETRPIVVSQAERCAIEIAFEMFGQDGPNALKKLEEIISRHFPAPAESEAVRALRKINLRAVASEISQGIPGSPDDHKRLEAWIYSVFCSYGMVTK